MARTARARGLLRAALSTLAGLLLLGAAPAPAPAPEAAVSGVAVERVPVPARKSLPLITELTASQCPELPPLWVVAQVQAESGWDPELESKRPGGPAGLYQLNRRNWEAAGGQTWGSDPPASDASVLSAEDHLRVAIPWVCANLRAVTSHLQATGKPTAPLDAMLVCHIAGCGRVTGSATGVPAAGEAGCGERCAQVVRRYLAAVHSNLDRFAAPPPEPAAAPAPAPAAAPAAWTGGATACRPPDPTGDGCLTGAARHGLEAAATAFGSWSGGPVIHSAGCWDKHAWNPRSDHSRGRACDLFPTTPGTFPKGAELDAGWRVADWFRANAEPLRVKYLIWQGRYWDPSVKDDGGWGRRYTGGGVYDVRDATGGHFDHVHVSFRE
ncbi:hypothetical protein [Pseudonocardia xinjiangensis]|uniref:ARB-07466-like C-terminal domain-containing protein n=1 Tax=Pseudonocardia xinjiangensis TaxID=75289 RepID=A0ABX1RLD1_9PSEU|nr:hypothetical protein [Pseudonocardia xinjiangensis]NMH80444.1 hypothetical protein [Pseudonocardia xinjiangensis]